MVWDEWEKLKGEAAGRRAAGGEGDGMRLAGVGGGSQGAGSRGAGGAGGAGVLSANQQQLSRVGGDAYALFQRLGREGRGPVAASAKAAGDLKGQGFALGGGLHRVQERWGQQVRSLVDACAHVAQRMDFTGKVHREDELAVHRVVSSIARLETAFEERSERRGGGGGPGGGGPGGHGPARGKPEGGR